MANIDSQESIGSKLMNLVPKDALVLKANDYLCNHRISSFSTLSKDKKENEDNSNVIESATQLAGAAVSVINATQLSTEELEQIAQQMVAAALSEISNIGGQVIGEFTGKATSLVTSIPGKITSATMNRFNSTDKNLGEIKLSIGDFVEKFTKDYEDIIDKKIENTDLKEKTEKIDKVQKSISNTVGSVKEWINKANKEIEKIQNYAIEGPEYVSKLLENKINATKENITKILNDNFEETEKSVNDFCTAQGNKIGERMVTSYNNTIHKIVQKQFEQVENGKTKVKILANTAILNAKLKIMGLMGI